MFSKSIASIIIGSCFLCAVVSANSVTDDLVTNEVKSLLNKEADIPTKQLKISTKDGVVLLDGTVETRLQADRIVEVANSVDNVKDVDTYKLKVVSSNQYLTDAFITSAVKGKLTWLIRHGKIGKYSHFHVETTNGNVHIFGNVEDNQDVSIITREVGRIKGVKQVRCNIDNWKWLKSTTVSVVLYHYNLANCSSRWVSDENDINFSAGETNSLVINTIFPYADPIIKVYAYLRTKQVAANGLLSRKENELLCDLFDLDYFGLNLDKYIEKIEAQPTARPSSP